MALSAFLTGLLGFVLFLALSIYIFGLPSEIKRMLERKALETMGENKASYILKDQISKVPTTDQQELDDTKNELSNALGSAVKNPLGDFAGETADTLASPFTGR